MNRKKEILSKYLPQNSIDQVVQLTEDHPFHLKIVRGRKTKHGDFKRFPNGQLQITINNDLNKYRFLVTLIHEIAHLVTYNEYSNVKPHGEEWQKSFQYLMLPFLNPEIFPDDILKKLAKYLKRAKASTDSDLELSLALKKHDESNGKHFIFEIPVNSKFEHNRRIFVRGDKRRTRYECLELPSRKKYLFHQNAEVNLLT